MPQGERSSGRSAPLIMCSPGSAAEADVAGPDALGAAGAAALGVEPPDTPLAGTCAGWLGALGAAPVAGADAAGAGEAAGAVPCPV